MKVWDKEVEKRREKGERESQNTRIPKGYVNYEYVIYVNGRKPKGVFPSELLIRDFYGNRDFITFNL